MIPKSRMQTVAKIFSKYSSNQIKTEYHASTGIKDSDFQKIPLHKKTGENTGHIFAIDGSNALVLDCGTMNINSIRTGYSIYSGRKWLKTVITYDDLFISDPADYRSYFEECLRRTAGTNANFVLAKTELERLSTYFRELQEYIALYDALHEAKSGDLILYDGGFHTWVEVFKGLIQDIFGEAGAKGVDIVGISKSSNLTWGNGLSMPFVPNTSYIGSTIFFDDPWFLSLEGKKFTPPLNSGNMLGRLYIAKFHPGSGYAFRVDVPDYISGRVPEVFSTIAQCSDSAECTGYPHPLFRAHHDIKITDSQKENIRLGLINEMAGMGLNDRHFREITLSFHDVLDMVSRK